MEPWGSTESDDFSCLRSKIPAESLGSSTLPGDSPNWRLLHGTGRTCSLTGAGRISVRRRPKGFSTAGLENVQSLRLWTREPSRIRLQGLQDVRRKGRKGDILVFSLEPRPPEPSGHRVGIVKKLNIPFSAFRPAGDLCAGPFSRKPSRTRRRIESDRLIHPKECTYTPQS